MYTVLFVDDNKNIRDFCRRELEQEGYRVLVAGDGEEALAALEQVLPDLVILDIRMPRMGGFEAIEQLLNQNSDIPVIFYTAHKDDLDYDFRASLAEAYLEKSEDLAELKSAVGQILARRERTVAPS